ncbi:hypothetical protein [Bradyrhizobium sp. SUTN9-2]|uniref:hypothetical protein n=1 Tax=Bradyrhizobium sp. SUTN9-2 TaxID=1167456 RepID=UPI001304862A|nr:hypothetical protein [Bradyrhizobium sp. SUTN9-2]
MTRQSSGEFSRENAELRPAFGIEADWRMASVGWGDRGAPPHLRDVDARRALATDGSVITITGAAAFPVYTVGSEAGWRPCGIGLHWFSVSFASLLWLLLILRPQTIGPSACSAAMKTAWPRAHG